MQRPHGSTVQPYSSSSFVSTAPLHRPQGSTRHPALAHPPVNHIHSMLPNEGDAGCEAG